VSSEEFLKQISTPYFWHLSMTSIQSTLVYCCVINEDCLPSNLSPLQDNFLVLLDNTWQLSCCTFSNSTAL